jgi:hypothetical protein
MMLRGRITSSWGVYKHKFLQLQYNLLHSPDLKQKIVTKRLKTKDVINMKPDELWKGRTLRKENRREDPFGHEETICRKGCEGKFSRIVYVWEM